MTAPALRLDKWLWHARFCKTRALAQKIIENGLVTINGSIAAKTSAAVRAGDRVSIVLGPVRRALIVRQLGERRGSAAEAQTLYEEPTAPQRLPPDEASVPLHRLTRRG